MLPSSWCFFILLKSVTSFDVLKKNSSVIEFIMEHAKWRNWRSVVFITSSVKEYETKNSQLLHATSKALKLAAMSESKHFHQLSSHFGIVSFWRDANSTLHLPSSLIICDGKHNTSLKENLEAMNTSLNIASDLVVAYWRPCKNAKSCQNTLYLEQVYKTTNLTVKPLGEWNFGSDQTFNLTRPEVRKGDLDTTVRIGVKKNIENTDFLASLAEEVEEKHMLFLIRGLFSAINVSYEYITFPKLGSFSEDGGWTYLLGALAEGTVDIAADVVDTNIEGIRAAMHLSNPIIKSMSNIYLCKPKGGKVRDVLLATFSPPLQFCVFLTALLLWISMFTLTTARARKLNFLKKVDRVWEPTEALLWAISVLCMQGSPWVPRSLSGCILLIFSLIFALITYNSFGAFITSILSVQDNAISNANDLLNSEFTFGYIQNSPEEYFLRTSTDPTLRTLYYRGLVAGGGVDDVSIGMKRTYSETYAFFANVRYTRPSLRIVVPSLWRCRIIEINVPSTATKGAIPMSKFSPFNPLIKFWMLRMREFGILPYIQQRLLLPMPTCTNRQLFHGAGISDISTAYAVLILGFVSSWIILVLEIIWAKRKFIFSFCKRNQLFYRTPNQEHYPHKKSFIWGQTEFIH